MIDEEKNIPCSEECCEAKPLHRPLWGLTYHVGKIKGVAIVRAIDGPEAVKLFKKDSNFNGTPNAIKVDSFAIIPETDEHGLALEMYFDTTNTLIKYNS